MKRATVMGMAALSMGLLPACQIVNRERHTYVTGTALTPRDVNSIEVGRTPATDLIARFGAPTSREDRPDGTGTWKWCSTTTDSSSGHVLVLWDRSSMKTTTQCTTVEIANGVVTAVHRE